MTARVIEASTPDGPMPVYESVPDGEGRGGVVVVQEAFGVTHHIEQVAESFAAAGWHAVAPALFHRQGSPVFGYGDFAAVMPAMRGLTAGGIASDVEAALGCLAGAGYGPERQGIVGFCMGGSVAFHTAVDRKIGAAVTYYGGGVSEGRFGYAPQLERAGSLQTPWLGLYGDLDPSIPPEQVEALREAVKAAGVPSEVVRYAGAQHGFNCDDRPEAYNPEAATDAWRRSLTWLDARMASGD